MRAKKREMKAEKRVTAKGVLAVPGDDTRRSPELTIGVEHPNVAFALAKGGLHRGLEENRLVEFADVRTCTDVLGEEQRKIGTIL
jgi:hypothetical protein